MGLGRRIMESNESPSVLLQHREASTARGQGTDAGHWEGSLTDDGGSSPLGAPDSCQSSIPSKPSDEMRAMESRACGFQESGEIKSQLDFQQRSPGDLSSPALGK